MTVLARTLLENIVNDKPETAADAFKEMILEKIKDRLEETRGVLAANLYEGPEEYDDEDDEEETDDDDSEDEDEDDEDFEDDDDEDDSDSNDEDEESYDDETEEDQ